MADILIAATNGFKGIGEALGAVFPATTLQMCIVHLIRSSLDFANWKDRKLLAAALRPVYTAPSAEAAEAALDEFERGAWGQKYPTVMVAWRRAWERVIRELTSASAQLAEKRLATALGVVADADLPSNTGGKRSTPAAPPNRGGTVDGEGRYL